MSINDALQNTTLYYCKVFIPDAEAEKEKKFVMDVFKS